MTSEQRRAWIEVKWDDDGADVPALLEAVCDLLATVLCDFGGVKNASIAATLNGKTSFRDPPLVSDEP